MFHQNDKMYCLKMCSEHIEFETYVYNNHSLNF